MQPSQWKIDPGVNNEFHSICQNKHCKLEIFDLIPLYILSGILDLGDMFAKFHSMSASIHLKSLIPKLSATSKTKRE
jgi:hypothetical protein